MVNMETSHDAVVSTLLKLFEVETQTLPGAPALFKRAPEPLLEVVTSD